MIEKHGVVQAFATIRGGAPVRVHRGKQAVRVLDAGAVAPGELTIVEAEGQSIGISRIDGALRAIRNECPHNGAPLCRGTLSGTYPPGEALAFGQAELDGRILACPWHGRQFDVVTGQALYEPGVSALTYEVWEDDGGVFVRV
jgi:nitrite reductase (NADH) small subunit